MTGKELAEKIAPFLREFIEERSTPEEYYFDSEDFIGVPEVMKKNGIGASTFRVLLKLCLVEVKNYQTHLDLVEEQ